VGKQPKSLIKSALAMSLGTFSSRILGLVRDIVVSSQFSVTITDAWFVAFKIPNLLRRVFGEGAFSASFIPQFVEARAAGEQENHRFYNATLTMLCLILFSICCLGIFFSEELVLLLASGKGFTEIPGKIAATIRYTRIMFFFLFFISVYAFFMAVLNTLKQFFWPAFVPVFFNISLIIFALLPQSWLAYPADLLSVAVVFGGFLQMAFLLPAIIRAGYLPKPSFDFRQSRVLRVFRNMLPGMVTIGILQFTTLINVRFASEIANGANSWIYYADRLLELPLSLISVSLGTVLLPSLSEAFAAKEEEDFNATMASALSFALFLAIPSAGALYFLSQPLISTIFFRGEFRYEDMQMTASVLQVYAFSLLTYSVMKILNAAFYAVKKYWFPTAISGFILFCHFFLVQELIPFYGVQALPLSTVISSSIALVLLVVLYQWQIFCFPIFRLLKKIVIYVFCSALMVTSFAVHPLFRGLLPQGEIGNILALGLTVLIASLVYLGFSVLLRVDEAERFLQKILNKLKAS